MATPLITRIETQAPVPATIRGDDIDLPSLVTTLNENKRLILFGTALGRLISVAYVMLATPKDEAIAVVQVESRLPSFPGVSARAGSQAPMAEEAPAATESQSLTSRRVLGEALQNLRLDIDVKPSRLPLVGDIVARQYQKMQPGTLSEPWFGLSRYG